MKYPTTPADRMSGREETSNANAARGQGARERIEAAVRSPYNLFGLSVAVAATAVTLTPWPLLAGVAIEAGYLGLSARGFFSRRPVAAEAPGQAARKNSTDREHSLDPTPGQKQVVKHVEPPLKLPQNMGMSADAHERYARLEAAFRLIRLQLDEGSPLHRELLCELELLMDRFMYFADKELLFQERLQTILSETKSLRAKRTSSRTADLKLVYAAGDIPGGMRMEDWVQSKIKMAHGVYEDELREISWTRQTQPGAATDSALEQRAKYLTRCSKQVDKIGKTLLNLHYELQLLENKFAATNHELSTRRTEQVLADIKALVLQTQSLVRAVEEVEAIEPILLESAAA